MTGTGALTNLLDERNSNNEGGGDKGPDSADDGPRVEAGEVEHVDAEHGSGPDADEERREEDAGDVGRDLGRAELADDDVEGRAVVEVLALLQVQLSLVRISKNENRFRDMSPSCTPSKSYLSKVPCKLGPGVRGDCQCSW